MTQNLLPFAQDGESKIELFQKNEIRKKFHNNEWWFSVKDVLEAIAETTDGNRYSRDLRNRDEGLKLRWAEITRTLKFPTVTGVQDMTFINMEGIFRLIQSIPTKKIEPFKKWLAKVGFERIQEIQDPEIAIKRAMAIYKAKGYDDAWIDARVTNTFNRNKLTDEWQKRGVIEKTGFLTDAIHIEALGITTTEHKKIKGLKGQSLRDNMTSIELTLSTLGEQATTEIIKAKNAQGFNENYAAAKSGGKIAGTARQEIEAQTGKKVVTSQNFLTERQRQNNQEALPEGLDNILSRIAKVPKKDSE